VKAFLRIGTIRGCRALITGVIMHSMHSLKVSMLHKKYQTRLVLVFVLYFCFAPGVSERVDECAAHGGLAEVEEAAGEDEEGRHHQAVVEALHRHRRHRTCSW